MGEDGGVIDFLQEEAVEVVFEVSENFATHYRLFLQVVGEETQFQREGYWGAVRPLVSLP